MINLIKSLGQLFKSVGLVFDWLILLVGSRSCIDLQDEHYRATVHHDCSISTVELVYVEGMLSDPFTIVAVVMLAAQFLDLLQFGVEVNEIHDCQ